MRQLIFLTIISAILFFSCEEKRTEFIYLDKISGKTFFTAIAYGYKEVVLIDHAPENRQIRDSLIWDYFVSHRVDFCKLDSGVLYYSMSFYRKTGCTSYYIDHGYVGGGPRIDNDEDDWDAGCSHDEITLFFYHRSTEDPKLWYQSYPDDCHDTIRCE